MDVDTAVSQRVNLCVLMDQNTYSTVAIINTECQHYRLWTPLERKSLGLSVRKCLDEVHGGGPTHSECGQYLSTGYGPGPHPRNRKNWSS